MWLALWKRGVIFRMKWNLKIVTLQELDLGDSPNLVHLGTNLFAKNHLIGVVSVSGCHQLSIEPNAFTIVMPSTGNILILLQHIFGLFWTAPTTYLIGKRHQHLGWAPWNLSVLNSNLMIPDFPHNIRIRLAQLKKKIVAPWRCSVSALLAVLV